MFVFWSQFQLNLVIQVFFLFKLVWMLYFVYTICCCFVEVKCFIVFIWSLVFGVQKSWEWVFQCFVYVYYLRDLRQFKLVSVLCIDVYQLGFRFQDCRFGLVEMNLRFMVGLSQFSLLFVCVLLIFFGKQGECICIVDLFCF